jgi:hypothetical protein
MDIFIMVPDQWQGNTGLDIISQTISKAKIHAILNDTGTRRIFDVYSFLIPKTIVLFSANGEGCHVPGKFGQNQGSTGTAAAAGRGKQIR